MASTVNVVEITKMPRYDHVTEGRIVDKPCEACGEIMSGVDLNRKFCDKCLYNRRKACQDKCRADRKAKFDRGEEAVQRRNDPVKREAATCLKCGKIFMSFNKRKNRICPKCKIKNADMARHYTDESLTAMPMP